MIVIQFLSKMIVEKEEQSIIKGILNVRCREGATIADIERKSMERYVLARFLFILLLICWVTFSRRL